MSLDNNTKRQLNDIVDAIDGRIEDAIDKREVENKKQSIFGNSSPVNEFSSKLKKEWNGIERGLFMNLFRFALVVVSHATKCTYSHGWRGKTRVTLNK